MKKLFVLAVMLLATAGAQAYTLLCSGSGSGCRAACANLGGVYSDRGNYSRCTVATLAQPATHLTPRNLLTPNQAGDNGDWQFACDAAAGDRCVKSCAELKGTWSNNSCKSAASKVDRTTELRNQLAEIAASPNPKIDSMPKAGVTNYQGQITPLRGTDKPGIK